MQPSKKFTLRVAIYSIGLLYLAGDLFLFHGPVHQRIQRSRPDSPEAQSAARERGVVATIGGRPIYLSQVERATIESLWLRGKRLEDLTPEQRRTERLAALNELVDHGLLREELQYRQEEYAVSDEEIDAAVKRLASRFANREEMKTELAAEGIDSEQELRFRLAARLQQEKYIEDQLAEHIAVTEEEARSWFEKHHRRFDFPPRVRARHVFLATLNRESDEAEATLRKALDEWNAGSRSFDQLVADLSEDTRSKASGGDLGWMTESRLPADFGEPLFAMSQGERRLLRTKIGWHLVEVTDTRPAEARTFEDARDEVVAALESARRIEMVPQLRKALREDPDAITVHVFTDMIPSE